MFTFLNFLKSLLYKSIALQFVDRYLYFRRNSNIFYRSASSNKSTLSNSNSNINTYNNNTI